MKMTNEDLDAAIRGVVKYTWGKGGPEIQLRLSKNQITIFQESIQQGFVVKSGNQNVFPTYSAWCSINHKPQITLKHKIKYSEIEVDMIFTNKCISVEGQIIINSLFKNSYPEKYAKYECANVGGTFTSNKYVFSGVPTLNQKVPITI